MKNTDNLDTHAVLPVIIHKQSFRATFALIVAGTETDRIDIAPIGFHLRMYGRVAIDLACRCLQDFRLDAFGQSQHIDGPHNRRLDRLDWIILIMNGGRGTSQVIDFVHLGEIRRRYIVAHQFEIGIRQQMHDVRLAARKIIVQTNDLMALSEQIPAQMRTDEPGASRYQYAFHFIPVYYNPTPK